MRHAIYFSPASGSLFHRLGSSWLGRDAVSNQIVKQPAIEGIREVTADPHRYGFHATLKAPFTLRNTLSRTDLGDAVARLSAQRDAIPDCKLEVQSIDGFLALVPASFDNRIHALADDCVRELDSFREQPPPEELECRRVAGLSARQDEHLRNWGYPYVFDEFRFHMTLTRRLSETQLQKFKHAARSHFASVLNGPVPIDALTIFTEPKPGADFVDEERFPLRRAARERAAS
jgi:putative phosphonate metabolism protein